MATRPYLLLLQSIMAGNGTGTVSYPVPSGEYLTVEQLVFQSTGAFWITDIRDSEGNHYTNASQAVGIPSAVLASSANNNNAVEVLAEPLAIQGGGILYIDLLEKSGSGNTVTLLLSGHRGTGESP